MKVEPYDRSGTRYIVTSESEGEKAYIVELAAIKIGDVWNGICGLTSQRINGCRHFVYKCDTKERLQKPGNASIFRCKHIEAARSFLLHQENILDRTISLLHEADDNIPDEHQV